MSPPGDRREPLADTKCLSAAQRSASKRSALVIIKTLRIVLKRPLKTLICHKYDLFRNHMMANLHLTTDMVL